MEGFTSDSSGNVQVNTQQLKYAATSYGPLILLYILLMISLAIATCVGSSRLSYCYNISIGNTGDVAFLFAFLCFFFPTFYYPYYALFLNPVCIAPRGILGGRRR